MYKINPFKEQDGSVRAPHVTLCPSMKILLLEIKHTFNEEMADGQTDIMTTSRDSVGAKHKTLQKLI